MSSDIDRKQEIEVLRERLAQYERAFSSVAPRLAAFKRLEELARSAKTSVEAVASSSAVEVLQHEKSSLEEKVRRLEQRRNDIRRELDELGDAHQQKRDDMIILREEHEVLASEVAEILDEIDSIRDDAIRLIRERQRLEEEVEALRAERQALLGDSADGDEVTVTPARRATDPVAVFDVDDVSDEESEAFDRFFSADGGKDKARDWMLR